MINKFVIIISFLPLIAASGCSDEPVSGSVDVASTNLEANFETPPRDRARGPSQVALRQQLRKKGWMVYPLVPELGLGEGLGVSPTGSQHFGDQDLLLVRKIENVRLVTLYAHEDLSGYSPKSESKSTFSSEGLAHLQAMPSIREIRIRGTEIDEEGLAHLVTLPNLRKLSYGKQITDLGMMQIKQMRGLEELELYIGDDRVTPGGFESLAELDHLSTLKLIIGVPVSKKLLSPLREFRALH